MSATAGRLPPAGPFLAGLPEGDAPLRMVVLGDSTCFIDGEGPRLPGDPGVWPTLLAKQLGSRLGREVTTTVIARPGLTVVDAWDLVAKDQHVQFEVLLGADAVVLSVGSFDHAPWGMPAVVKAVVPHLRPDGLRRRARRALHATYPWVVRATGGRYTRTPEATFDLRWDQLLLQVRGLANRAAMAALGPTSHRSPYYGDRHPRHADRERRQGELAAAHHVPYLPTWPLVEPHADRLNADGIHWPREAHEAVAEALVPVLSGQLMGQTPRPGIPELPEVS